MEKGRNGLVLALTCYSDTRPEERNAIATANWARSVRGVHLMVIPTYRAARRNNAGWEPGNHGQSGCIHIGTHAWHLAEHVTARLKRRDLATLRGMPPWTMTKLVAAAEKGGPGYDDATATGEKHPPPCLRR